MLFTLLNIACRHNEKSDAYGNFEAVETIISAENNGKLLTFDIEEGMTLEPDIVIGIIDTLPSYLQKQQLVASKKAVASKVSHIFSQINIYKEQESTLLTEKKRVENLLKDGAATSKQLDDINGQLNVIRKQIQSIETQNRTVLNEIRSMEWQIELMDENLNKCRIINPVKGTVLEKYAEKNEFANVGKSLYKIANLEELDLRVYISGAQLPHIKLGQKVEVLIDEDAEHNRSLEGTVTWISDQSEFSPKMIQTKEERVKLVYAAKVRVKNDGSFKIGMPGEINFIPKED